MEIVDGMYEKAVKRKSRIQKSTETDQEKSYCYDFFGTQEPPKTESKKNVIEISELISIKK